MALSAMPPCSICMNAADESSIRFSLGHFLGFTDVVISFVAILLVPRHPSLTGIARLSASDYQALAKADLYLVFGDYGMLRISSQGKLFAALISVIVARHQYAAI
jgi:hypothetical protein